MISLLQLIIACLLIAVAFLIFHRTIPGVLAHKKYDRLDALSIWSLGGAMLLYGLGKTGSFWGTSGQTFYIIANLLLIGHGICTYLYFKKNCPALWGQTKNEQTNKADPDRGAQASV